MTKKLGFEVFKIAPADPNDSRGMTYGWKLDEERQIKQITILERWKGNKFGGHYHKGDDSSKNPERFFVARGKIRFKFITPENVETEVIAEAGDLLTIYPNVMHFAEALEDTVLVEYRVTPFDKQNPDTYPCES